MTARASATRYARALLDVVIQEGEPEKVERELSAVADLYSSTPELQKALTNPAVPVAAKRGIVEALLTKTESSPVLGRLLLMLADRNRLVLLPELASVYHQRLMEHRQIDRAEVTTALPLSPEQAAQLEQRLGAATGRHVMMTTQVDPSLIGGAVARVGSTIYDGSIATQLAKMRERLEEQR